jgi:hypothetical protein
MYGLPEDVDTGMFVGRTIDQVCFTVNQVLIHLDDDLHLIIEGEFSLAAAGAAASGAAGEGVASGSTAATAHHEIARLVGARIVRARGTRDGTLTLECESGDVLQLFDVSPMYEAYTILHRGQEWII